MTLAARGQFATPGKVQLVRLPLESLSLSTYCLTRRHGRTLGISTKPKPPRIAFTLFGGRVASRIDPWAAYHCVSAFHAARATSKLTRSRSGPPVVSRTTHIRDAW